MSDDYRDGCPSKRFTIGWFLVQAVYFAAWLSSFGRKVEK